MRRPVSPTLPLSGGPLPLAEFWSDLRFIGSTPPMLTENSVQNSTSGGEVIGASWGARLWRFQVQLAAMYRSDLDILAGRLDMLADSGLTFLATPPFRAFPAFDPQGLYLSDAAPVIDSLPVGGQTLTLSGLPGHYILTAGDFISFTRGTPARHELHRLVTGGRADDTGLSPLLQVVPPLRPGVAVGAAVAVVNPVMRGRIVPGSLKASGGLVTVAGPSFEVMQTLQKAG
jgi:hypothetical protein